MLAELVMAAAAATTGTTLGVWPEELGPPAAVVEEVEVYIVDPEDEYWVIAVAPLAPALALDDAAAVAGVVRLAHRLGAEAVVLLGELSEAAIPEDVEGELAPTGKYAAVAFLGFEYEELGEEGGAAVMAHADGARRGGSRSGGLGEGPSGAADALVSSGRRQRPPAPPAAQLRP